MTPQSPYQEISETVTVPKNTGRAGLFHAIEAVLKLPRVQSFRFQANGRLDYKYVLRDGETKAPLNVDLDTLSPYAVLRSGEVEELPVEGGASKTLLRMLLSVHEGGLYPSAFVGGPKSSVWRWLEEEGVHVAPRLRESLLCVPFLEESRFTSDMLFLGASHTPMASLVDTQRCFKVLIPIGDTP